MRKDKADIAPSTGLGDEYRDPCRYIRDVSLGHCRRFEGAHIRTHTSKVHKAGEGDDPEVFAIDDVTTIKLDELALGRVDVGSNRRLTKRPSANKEFKRAPRPGAMPDAPEQVFA